MLNLSDICSDVCKIASEAGDYLKTERLAFDSKRIEKKGVHNYVSYVDKTSEKFLIEKLSECIPGSGFIAEEGSAELNNEEYYWVIDPLDGTSNFIHDIYPYAVSIALRTRDEILLGVVYEVGRKECFYAWKDGGAFLNGKAIHVSSVSSLDSSFIAIGLPYDSERYKPVANRLINRLYGYAAGTRLLGAAAPEICYVACGRFEGRIEAFLGPWDVAAAGIILQEAGGVLSDFKGLSTWDKAIEVVASNGHIQDQLLDLTAGYAF